MLTELLQTVETVRMAEFGLHVKKIRRSPPVCGVNGNGNDGVINGNLSNGNATPTDWK